MTGGDRVADAGEAHEVGASLRFESLAGVRAFVNGLDEACAATGAWTAAQMLYHLAAAFELSRAAPASAAGRAAATSRVARLRAAPKRLVALHRGLPAGVPIPAALAERLQPPADAALEPERARLLAAMAAFEAHDDAHPPHPVLGPLTHEEWTQFHLRHCELHLRHLGRADRGSTG